LIAASLSRRIYNPVLQKWRDEMNNEAQQKVKSAKSHSPLLPQQEVQSNFEAVRLFVPLVLKYLARHLTVGTYIRIRRIILRRLGRTYYV
jgi:hypothetical protein